ncbi:MAG: penicillin-binding protein 1C [Steroidobacteraceae bacterium]|nr:penicillin-binding protein 1C [Steroidobacteraceae bacterium]
MNRRGRRLALLGAAGLAAVAGVVAVALGVAVVRVPSFAEVRAAHVSSEAMLLDRHGRTLQTLRLDTAARRLEWTSLDAVSPRLVEAVLAVEDRRYRGHGGVDPLAIGAAVRDGLRRGEWRGASTLTMQLATSLRRERGRPTRGAWAKLAQARDALALEARWSKDQILEAYLNRVTFRGELQGIAAAARALYGRQPGALTAQESWLLASALRAPGATPAAIARRACALARWPAPQCAEAAALAASAFARPAAIPPAADLAPHLARRLLSRPGERVATSLDAELQRYVRDVLAAQLDRLGSERVRDGAAIVVDSATGEVLAYVGSAGPASRAAQVDGARARRQAGSTLKPFLYALALEQQRLTPASLLDDGPLGLATDAGLYVPQNYDRSFRGLVSLRVALASSLNVPAVRTLLLLGPDALHRELQELGYAGLVDDPAHYGWSLALGTADVSLLEQVNAYRTLANGGRWSPLQYAVAAAAITGGIAHAHEPANANEPANAAAARQVVDPRAAWLVADILADRGARAPTFGLESALATRAWSAVKTGTSKDLRDNWCVGFTRRYTVGVWVGNFEGDPMRAVSGVSGAAPAWAAIVDRLEGGEGAAAPPVPTGLVAREVAFDGREPPRREWFYAGTEQERVVPPAPRAQVARIVAPADGTIVALDPDIPPHLQRVPLLAEPANAGRWRVNGRPLAEAAFWSPVGGRHRIELVDAAGRPLAAVTISVRGAPPGE